MATDELQNEVERRLAALRDDPEALMRYDANGDGVIDDEEWEEVRRVVTAEVQTELRRSEDGGPEEEVESHTAELLQDRYQLVRQIGRGGQGRTYFGTDQQTGEPVAIKELELRSLDDWKAIELFEREGQVLRSLDHRAIPSYVDAFHLTDDESNEERFFLVQEFVDGQSLEQLLDDGLRMDEEQAKGFMREMLEILAYLHGLSPAVIHRDIKPSNIMRRTDQSLALIDFGAVQAVTPDDGVASTVVGTSGYMPLEQLMGRATPATDLYALAATTVHLLSHRHPADLPVKGMALQFTDAINASRGLTRLLQEMLAPHEEDRISSAHAVLRRLDALTDGEGGGYSVAFGRPEEESSTGAIDRLIQRSLNASDRPDVGHERAHPPAVMRSTLDETPEALHVEVAGPTFGKLLAIVAIVSVFLLFGLTMVAIALSDPSENLQELGTGCFFSAISLLGLYGVIANLTAKSIIIVSEEGLTVRRTSLRRSTDFLFKPRLPLEVDLKTTHIRRDSGSTRTVHKLHVHGGGKSFELGEHLKLEEVQYLVGRIRRRIEEEERKRQKSTHQDPLGTDQARPKERKEQHHQHVEEQA